ncbi:MAG: hypothetical protein HZA78_00155 [Candidatus Schekmanbacteria bacterium]|nr:hypothetical protein [Candidatus Schekmanbacteria bacterium]
MKNKLKPLILLLSAGIVIFSGGCAATKELQAEPVKKVILSKGPKKRVAVIDFENKTAYGRERLGSSAADILTTELVKSQQFIVIERAKLNQIMEEQGLGMSGVIDPKTATRAGQILGLNAIVTGAVSQFGIKSQGTDVGFYKSKLQIAETAVDLRVIDTGTGQILLAETGQGSATTETSEVLGMGGRAGYDETLAGKALRSAIAKFIDNIVQTMRAGEWAGRIAQVEGGTVYINAGQQVGLAINDKLDVYRPGKEISDPVTGLSLGFTQSKIGQVQITGFFGENGSTAVPVVGVNFQTNDIVKLAQ